MANKKGSQERRRRLTGPYYSGSKEGNMRGGGRGRRNRRGSVPSVSLSFSRIGVNSDTCEAKSACSVSRHGGTKISHVRRE